MNLMKSVLCLALVAVMSVGAIAEDGAKKKGEGAKKKGEAAQKKGEAGQKKGERGKKRPAPSVTSRFVGKLDLSAEQKEKIAAIDKEFAGQFAEIRKAQTGILTEEQVKARNELLKKAREAKEKPNAELRKQIAEVTKLSDEQKKKMGEVQKASRELHGKVIAALKKVLTEEQIKNLPQQRRGGQKGEGRPRTDAARKAAAEKRKAAAAKKDSAKKGEAAKKDGVKKE